ncbi:copper chaperone [Actinobacillus succinogenes]|uniref:Heavy metal transport/detoxification protein n=1 Tax=Actinobacillus succinogenes (strain ATCC 55618 / DSM 22257 / CCUG 43843 / 130Z) TaxID=339671 RepID=A6VMB3_ACTSZ|nr:heavy-metal-associated domain-containing protein [Actinobacillus succinogenes]ABR74110.1 Heavy metal transport/detoxification protein [Actinobacillus succinogenes 130Z]PHI39457.1 copper chaperone [Actinobacillus succinogenes]
MKKTFLFVTALLTAATGFAAERNITLHIEEMNCQLCVYLVNKELRNLDGVVSTKADFNTRLVKVIADEKVSDNQLVKAIDNLHYHAVVQE